MILVIENADKNLCIAIKNVVKLTDAKMTIQKEPSDRLLEAMKEVENGEVERYKNFKEFKKAMLKWNAKSRLLKNLKSNLKNYPPKMQILYWK